MFMTYCNIIDTMYNTRLIQGYAYDCIENNMIIIIVLFGTDNSMVGTICDEDRKVKKNPLILFNAAQRDHVIK